MKKMIVILGFALISSTVFAKTAMECRAELTQNHSILSTANSAKIHKIVKSSLSTHDKKKMTAAVLKAELCVDLIATANGQSVEGVADGLINEIQAIPADMLTVELIDTFVGMLIIEN